LVFILTKMTKFLLVEFFLFWMSHYLRFLILHLFSKLFKKIKLMKTLIKLLFITLSVSNSYKTIAQESESGLKFSFSLGVSIPKIELTHHSIRDNESYLGLGHIYSFGIETNVKPGFSLKTELGLISTDHFSSATVDVDEGFGVSTINLAGWIRNDKVYIGFIPTWKLHKAKRVDLNLFSGFLIAKDIAIILRANNSLSPHNSIKAGLLIGSDLNLKLGRVSLDVKLSYINFQKSQLINRYHPQIKYKHFIASFGTSYTF
jgi:hypothetical protein